MREEVEFKPFRTEKPKTYLDRYLERKNLREMTQLYDSIQVEALITQKFGWFRTLEKFNLFMDILTVIGLTLCMPSLILYCISPSLSLFYILAYNFTVISYRYDKRKGVSKNAKIGTTNQTQIND